jgi:hypothetical protein
VGRLPRQARIARREIAQSQHNLASQDTLPAAQADFRLLAVTVQRDSLILHMHQSAGMTFVFLLQQPRDVLTVRLARKIIAGLRAGIVLIPRPA